MKVTVKPPNITQFHFDFEEGDQIYMDCLWAQINLDHDSYTMTATSDCGDYSYRWHVTPNESFIKLMSRIGEEYLLYKISDQIVFDFDASKAELIERVDECCIDEWKSEAVRELEIMDCLTEESFVRKAYEIVGTWDYESIPVVKRYPIGAITFAKLFCVYLQPLLRELLKTQRTVSKEETPDE